MQKTESLPCEAHSSAEGETVNQEVQLALEQHRCELCGSTYMQIISVGNTMVLRGLLLVEPTDGKPEIRRAHCKLYSGFQVSGWWALEGDLSLG